MSLPKGAVDWRAAAETELGESVVDKPGAQRLAPLYVPELRAAVVHVITPAPLSITQASWLLVHENGVSVFHPSVLRIDIGYFGDDTAAVSKAGPSRFDGKACGKVPAKTGRAAFAFSGARPGTWTTKTAQFTQLPDSTLHVKVDGTNYTWRIDHSGSDGVKRAVVLQSGTKRLLMLVWDGSRIQAACDREYSLFEVARSGLRLIKESAYGCDI
jgi:hypothetical protein